MPGLAACLDAAVLPGRSDFHRSLLREGHGGFASRVHTWVNAKCASYVGSAKRRLATGRDASQHKRLCAGEATSASSRLRSDEPIAPNYAGFFGAAFCAVNECAGLALI